MFNIYSEFAGATLDDGSTIDKTSDPGIKFKQDATTYTLNNYEDKIGRIQFYIAPGVVEGEYIYNVYVCVDGTPVDDLRDKCPTGQKYYGGLHKVYIDVI